MRRTLALTGTDGYDHRWPEILSAVGAVLAIVSVALLDPSVKELDLRSARLIAPHFLFVDVSVAVATAALASSTVVAIVLRRPARLLFYASIAFVVAIPLLGLAAEIEGDLTKLGCSNFVCESLVGTVSASWLPYYATSFASALLSTTAVYRNRKIVLT